MEQENVVSPPLRSFGLAFDVLDGVTKFLLELFSVVSYPGKIGACPGRLLDGTRGFRDFFFGHPTEPQLLSMEGYSVGTVCRSGCAEGNKGLIPSRQFTVAHEP
jgi:hypothetical protein